MSYAVIALSVMMPVVADKIFAQLPQVVDRFLSSSVLIGTLSAVLLNLLFNGLPPRESEHEALAGAAEAARQGRS